jgi:hypothetical protein
MEKKQVPQIPALPLSECFNHELFPFLKCSNKEPLPVSEQTCEKTTNVYEPELMMTK